jgi:hypothetical protein
MKRKARFFRCKLEDGWPRRMFHVQVAQNTRRFWIARQTRVGSGAVRNPPPGMRHPDGPRLHQRAEGSPAQRLCAGEISFISIMPHLVADDDDRMGIAADVLARLKTSPKNGMNADGIKIVRRNDAPARSFSAIANAESGSDDLADESVLTERTISAQVLEIKP